MTLDLYIGDYMQRYFVNNKINNIFKITNDDYHHIVNVMRMNINDKIEVLYEKKLYLCEIENISSNCVNAKIIEEINENNELDVNITIAQALVKEDKMNYILQKSTELGINSFIPLIMDRSIIKIDNKSSDKKIVRWQKICKEASEQCKRNVVPTVNQILNIKELIKLDYDYKILCSLNEKETNIKMVLPKLKKHDKIVVVIGPEGGITNNEEKTLIENGFISVTLGDRVLRTETVAVFIASIINYELMR
jgi:16S rRNA (uracil1498-N3)-methyltransferase